MVGRRRETEREDEKRGGEGIAGPVDCQLG